MRGNPFHNELARKARITFEHFRWRVFTEHRVRANGTCAYFDLFAVNRSRKLACEIETTQRHAVDNAKKAQIVDIPLWFVVPTRRIKRQIDAKLKRRNITPGGERIKILLLTELADELTHYRPRKRSAN